MYAWSLHFQTVCLSQKLIFTLADVPSILILQGVTHEKTHAEKWNCLLTEPPLTPHPHSTAVRENLHMQQGFRRVQRAPITVIDSGWLSEAVRIYYGSDAAPVSQWTLLQHCWSGYGTVECRNITRLSCLCTCDHIKNGKKLNTNQKTRTTWSILSIQSNY